MQEERSLIKQARDGDMKAFRALVERHREKVFWLAYDLAGDIQDAEDLSQETFVKMFRALRSFRGDAKLSSWLHRITVNNWLSSSRRGTEKLKKIMQPLDEETAEQFPDGSGSQFSDPEKQADSDFMRRQILKALDRLSGRERSVFVMRHFHGSKTAEISKALSISIGTVKTLHFRAIRKMRNSLGHLASEV